MCGVAGAWDLVGDRDPTRMVDGMAACLRHRGPDDYRLSAGPGWCLAFRRLSLRDFDGGAQPFALPGGGAVACNGEIYNWRDLRHQFQQAGACFRSNSDCEVVGHAYKRWGQSLVEHLHGQFAIAIADPVRRQLFLARDRAGVCPLYWHQHDGWLFFASEVRAFLPIESLSRELSLKGLDQAMTLPGLCSPQTILSGVSSIAPGNRLRVMDGVVDVSRYWDLSYPLEAHLEPAGSLRAREAVAAEFRDLLSASVRSRVDADAGVGSYFSGGIDSSVVTSLADLAGGIAGTISLGMEDVGLDEGRMQQVLAEGLRSPHHHIHLSDQELTAGFLDAVVAAESPLRETYHVAGMRLAEGVAQSGMKAVLSGEGADELLGGYQTYSLDAMYRQSPEKNPDLTLPTDLLKRERQLRDDLWGDSDLRYDHDLFRLERAKKALYSSEIAAQYESFAVTGQQLVDRGQLAGRHPFHKRSYLDFKLRLGDHLLIDHGDKLLMSQSVEGRYPFLDERIVDLCRSLHPDVHWQDSTEKWVLREAASGIVPEVIRINPKQPFATAGSPAILGAGLVDYASEERSRAAGVFDPRAVAKLVDRFSRPGFRLNVPFDVDWLLLVISTHILIDQFDLKGVSIE